MSRRVRFQAQESARRLGAIGVFATLDADAIAVIASEIVWSAFEPGAQILSHLDQSREFYILSEGELEARLDSPIGRGVRVRRLQAGAHFGELAPLTGARRSVTLVATGDVVVGALGETIFQRLLQTQAGFAAALAVDLARSVVHLTERVYELAALEMRFRLYGQLLRLAVRTGLNAATIAPAPTHAEFAEMIGARREAVTLELNYLEREGVLLIERARILIVDMARLTDMFAKRAGSSPQTGFE